MPDAIRGRFVPAVVDAASQLVRTWCEEKQAHPFATVDALWNAAVDAVAFAPSPAQKPGAENDPWKKLGGATKQSGTVSAMNWAEFGPNAAASLAQELMQCAVQVSSNPDTTAFHGNAHGKLPRKIAADLADLPPAAQAAGTPYIEFLIPGHKKDYGIERGILDRERGLIYITAHYDTGSFVRLTGVPANVVADWQAKALRYAQDAQATGDD